MNNITHLNKLKLIHCWRMTPSSKRNF